jgi:hypothetical protein
VDILIVAVHKRRISPAFVEYRLQSRHDCARVGLAQNRRGAKGVGPRDAPGDVIFKECSIETERNPEAKGRRIRRIIEPA